MCRDSPLQGSFLEPASGESSVETCILKAAHQGDRTPKKELLGSELHIDFHLFQRDSTLHLQFRLPDPRLQRNAPFIYISMQSVLGSYDSDKYQKMMKTLRYEQKIIRLEENIDNERIMRMNLEQEAKLILTLIQNVKNRKTTEKNRSSSMYNHSEDNEYKEKAVARNMLRSTGYRD